MDPITTSIVTGIASGILGNFSTDVVKHFFTTVFSINPSIESKLQAAKTSTDIESIFREAVGVIDANADKGSIDVDGTLLEALRGIRFDHAHGTVNIAGSTLKAQVLVTGGSSGSTGQTTIGENTEMRSHGTSIQVGKGCSIVMTGGASIKQT